MAHNLCARHEALISGLLPPDWCGACESDQREKEIADLRARMVKQIRSLLDYTAKSWDTSNPAQATASDEKARFLWMFLPRFDSHEFDAELAAVRAAADRYVERDCKRYFL